MWQAAILEFSLIVQMSVKNDIDTQVPQNIVYQLFNFLKLNLEISVRYF